jgi:beta-glucosidase
MSYTSFEFSNIVVNKKKFSKGETIEVSCDVTNTGDIEGSEVVQVYIGKQKSKVKRALKELKGFNKVNVLQGETKTLKVSINVDKLAFYDEAISGWNLEKGDYNIYVGNASNHIFKILKIKID